MPSNSIGFWVAMTMKGRGSGRVSPSTLTCRSSIASSKAAWVRGVARFTSSASTTWLTIGPGRYVKAPVFGSKTTVPRTSDGKRSGVH